MKLLKSFERIFLHLSCCSVAKNGSKLVVSISHYQKGYKENLHYKAKNVRTV